MITKLTYSRSRFSLVTIRARWSNRSLYHYSFKQQDTLVNQYLFSLFSSITSLPSVTFHSLKTSCNQNLLEIQSYPVASLSLGADMTWGSYWTLSPRQSIRPPISSISYNRYNYRPFSPLVLSQFIIMKQNSN